MAVSRERIGRRHGRTFSRSASRVSRALSPVIEDLESRWLLSVVAPTGFVAAQSSPSAINFLWKDNASDETSYVIERKEGSGGSWSEWGSSLAADTQSCDRSGGLTAGNTYYFRAGAKKTDDTTEYSNEASIVIRKLPTVPGTWSDADIGSAQTAGTASESGGEFTLFTSPGGGSEAAEPDTPPGQRVHIAYLALSGNGEVIARVTSENGANEWAKAGIEIRAQDTSSSTRPYAYLVSTPYVNGNQHLQFGQSAGGQQTTEVNLTPGQFTPYWLRLTKSGTAITGYYSADGSSWTSIGNTADFGSLPGTVYVGLIVSSNSGSYNNTAVLDHVSIASSTVSGALAPTAVMASSASPTAVNLAWSDHATGETSVVLERSTDSSFNTHTDFTLSADAVTYTDTTVSANTTYYYRVKSVGSTEGTSAYSATASVTTPSGIPAAPTSLVSEPVRVHRIAFNWAEQADATNYNVYRQQGSTWQSVGQITATGAEDTDSIERFSETGLREDTQYTYRVKAVNSNGESAGTDITITTASFSFFQNTGSGGTGLGEVYVTAVDPDPQSQNSNDSLYESTDSNDPNYLHPRETSIKGAAAYAYQQPLKYLVLDIELWAQELRCGRSWEDDILSTIDWIKQAVAWAKEGRPELKVGLYAMGQLEPSPGRNIDIITDDNTTPDDDDRFDAAFNYFFGYRNGTYDEALGIIRGGVYNPEYDIRNYVDFFAPHFYIEQPFTADWLRGMELTLDYMKDFGKPVIPFINPTIMAGPDVGRIVTEAEFQQILQTVRKSADGVLIWGAAGLWTYSSNWADAIGTVKAQNSGNAPAAPAAPTSTTIDRVGMKLSWPAASGEVSGYLVERSFDGGATFRVVAAPAGTSWVDTYIDGGASYRYRIRAYNGFGVSTASNPVTPDAAQLDGLSTLELRMLSPNADVHVNSGKDYLGRLTDATLSLDKFVLYDDVVFGSSPTSIEITYNAVAAGEGTTVAISAGAISLGTWTVTQTHASDYGVYKTVRIPLTGAVAPGTAYQVKLLVTNDKGLKLRTVKFLPGADSTTQGNWRFKYGSEGVWIPESGTPDALPVATITPVGISARGTWSGANLGLTRFLQTPDGTSRIASWIFDWDQFTVTVQFNDNDYHYLSAYFVDGQNTGCEQTVQLLAADGTTILNTVDLADFEEGRYLTWLVQGTVHLKVDFTGTNSAAILNGLFFDVASKHTIDSATQGNWIGKYGAEEVYLPNGVAAWSSGTLIFRDAPDSYDKSTNDDWGTGNDEFRYLLSPANDGTRLHAVNYWNRPGEFDINLPEDRTYHRLSLYFNYPHTLGTSGWTIQAQLLNASGDLIDSVLVRDFDAGQYVSWVITGDVKVRLTGLTTDWPILAGLFLDPMTNFVQNDGETGGDWDGVYDGAGDSVIYVPGEAVPSPEVVFTTAPTETAWNYQGSANDIEEFPWIPGSDPAERSDVKAYWNTLVNTTEFTITPGDSNEHLLALYFLDYDDENRVIDVTLIRHWDYTPPILDKDVVLDTRRVSDFQTGEYLVWAIQGTVTVRLTKIAGPDLVLGGIFLLPPS